MSLAEHLANRRQEVHDRHRRQEEFPGTGWHPKDPNSPHHTDRKPISERPVAFQDDDQVYLAGEDADTVVSVLKEFAEEAGNAAPDRRAVALAENIERHLSRDDETVILTLPASKWNDLAHAMGCMGCDVCLADLHPPKPRKKK